MNNDSTTTPHASLPHDTPLQRLERDYRLRGEQGSLKDRFIAKIRVAPSGCWEWTACLNRTGYGQFRADGRTRLAHRVSYELYVGPIPAGLVIDHLCRNPPCVNPDHMEPVTDQVNVLRGVGPAALCAVQTHCVNGHPFDAENTQIRAEGGRRCLTCRRASNARVAAKKREKNRIAGKSRNFSTPRVYA